MEGAILMLVVIQIGFLKLLKIFSNRCLVLNICYPPVFLCDNSNLTSEFWKVPILVRGHFGVSGHSDWFLEVAKDFL